MRAVVVRRFGGPEVLVVEEMAEPSPGPGQVAIAVGYAGVNFADVMGRRGDYHRTSLPFVPGLEVAGNVVAAGEGVVEPGPGTAVAAFVGSGGYAEVVLANALLVFSIEGSGAPTEPAVVAALPTVAPTALFLLDEVARMRPGESVLVHAAAGGVGTMAGQMARSFGASLVLGTVSSPEKAKYAGKFGYDDVFVREHFVEKTRSASDGRGVDVVLDSIGGPTREASFEALAPMGRVVAFGNACGGPETFPSGRELRPSNKGVLGFSMGSLVGADPARVGAIARRAIEMVLSGRTHLDVTGVFPLERAGEAHGRIESGRSLGKLVLEVSP